MIREAKPLLNRNFLSSINVEVTKRNVSWYLKTTKERMKVIKSSINRIEQRKPDGKLSDAVAYSLILRLRTLYLIKCLMINKKYRKSEFLGLIKEISGSLTSYERYISAKNNQEYKRELPLAEGKRIYEHIEKYLAEINSLLQQN
jgi:hypothetical protein